MKYSRKIGLFWLFFALVFHGYGQNSINLEFRLPDPSGETGAAMLKKVRIGNPMLVKPSELHLKIDQMIGFYENSGYPFVQIRLDSVEPCPAGISGILIIDTGERITVDTLINRSGYRISRRVLSRLINIRPGDLYRESAVKEASRRLGQLQYMNQARQLEVGFHPGKASFYLYPEKASANRFDGWIGLSPNLGSSGKLAFTGAMTLDLRNILGQGENWQFHWQRNQDRSQKLDLSAHIPYLAGLPFGFRGKFDLFRQDTSYLNIGWEAGVPYHFSPDHLLNVFIRHRESSVIQGTSDAQNSERQPFVTLLSGLAWEYAKLDNPINPYRGFQFRIEGSTGRKSIPDSISMQQSELNASISWFQPLAKSITCALIFQSGYRKSPETYDNEQYRLGGLNLLRGFDEDVFHSDAFAVTSLEFRYLLDRASHLVILTDVGLLRMIENDNPVLKIPAGFGIGGQIRTSGGIFRIIFALGKQQGVPVSLKNSKIHLGYVGVF